MPDPEFTVEPAGGSPASHYDGRSATRHAVRVRQGAGGFTLDGADVRSGPHAWSDVVALGAAGGRSIYGLKGVQGWRLIFDGPPPEDFAIHLPLPARYGRWVDRLGLTRAAIAFAVIAAGVVFVALQAPAWVAPFVPRSVENRLGDAMIGDFGGRFCRTAQGHRALEVLATKLGAQAAGVRSVEVANLPMVNAVALPGGRVMIFDGLLKQARSPDEVAGVLAHEIGHVQHRDTMAGLIRQLGLSVILGGFNGNIGGAVNTLLSLSYTREAEGAADGYAIASLRSATISPEPTAAFFDRLSGGRGGETMERTMGWMSSHPISSERKAAFLRSKLPGKSYGAAMDATDWAALKSMCGADRKVTPASDLPW